MAADTYDANKCPHCGDTWQIRRIEPAAPRARMVHLRICSCDYPHCTNPRCKRPVPFTAARCPHCAAAA